METQRSATGTVGMVAGALTRAAMGLAFTGLGLVVALVSVWQAFFVNVGEGGGWGYAVGSVLAVCMGLMVAYCGWLLLAGVWRDTGGVYRRGDHSDGWLYVFGGSVYSAHDGTQHTSGGVGGSGLGGGFGGGDGGGGGGGDGGC